ncbi:MAG: hypothetical protein GX903_00920 [Spirochaetales bacterium]|nr:hypothetical protein [Spirochaetales bacterium]
MITSSNSEHIRLFAAFKEALLMLYKRDCVLFTRRKKRAGVSHHLAIYLERLLPYVQFIDLGYEIKLKGKDIYPDILLHNRVDEIQLAIFWQDGYLSKTEQDAVKRFNEETKANLTLAFAILPDKEYFLVYRFEEDCVQYMHIDKETGQDEFLKQCEEEEIGKEEAQAFLFNLPKSRKKKTTSLPKPETVQ